MSRYGLSGPVRDAMVHLQAAGRTVMEGIGGRLCIDGRPVDVRRLMIEANSAGADIPYPGIAYPEVGQACGKDRRDVVA